MTIMLNLWRNIFDHCLLLTHHQTRFHLGWQSHHRMTLRAYHPCRPKHWTQKKSKRPDLWRWKVENYPECIHLFKTPDFNIKKHENKQLVLLPKKALRVCA